MLIVYPRTLSPILTGSGTAVHDACGVNYDAPRQVQHLQHHRVGKDCLREKMVPNAKGRELVMDRHVQSESAGCHVCVQYERGGYGNRRKGWVLE